MSARPAYAVVGLALLALIWLLPDSAAPRFPLHMLRHMVLVALAAPLLVLGFPRLGRLMAMPALLATGLELLLVWGWHLPAAHGAAYRMPTAFVLEQATFLLVGLFVWAGCLHGPRLVGAGGLLLTSMHMTLLGALLTLAPRDLYAQFCGTPPDPEGQAVGGMLMLAIGTPIYLLAGVALAARALSDREAAI
ncbi:cytochrome c oxidase assembly protein [Paracoccus laeviglucosivorans]|uniref:Putative membrane protein n=1 Tax=Paracoccus laeviglucosivorans TaxID=1197861 RepID=A0A521F9H3_9RHOB|nr:cytochrome c oxidase assembly protein [Paracoccus laeviglucosivorans]SMO92803.1 putative membrane protein [Paracoccus laeviglucosivorans]